MMSSIQQKISIGFYSFAATISVLALFAYLDLHYLEERIELYTIVAEYHDIVLGSRLYEQNFFLYGTGDDYEKARDHAKRAVLLVESKRTAFLQFIDNSNIQDLVDALVRYLQMLGRYKQSLDHKNAQAGTELERSIRDLGQSMTKTAEMLAETQRVELISAVVRSRTILLIAVGLTALLGILIAQLISRAATRPLKRLELDLRERGESHFQIMTPATQDKEIVSVSQALNHMLEEIKLRQWQLLQSEKLASLGTLVSGVAHELNSPISNISISCQILQEELEQSDPATLREWLMQIDEETERAGHIVHNLLEFSKKRTFKKTPVNLLSNLQKTLQILGHHKAVNVQTSIPQDFCVLADTQQLQQIFLNLINNAMDAGGSGVTIKIEAKSQTGAHFQIPAESVPARTSCPVKHNKQVSVITVQDNGPGIPTDLINKVFEPFVTTKDKGLGSGLGSGLGLFVIQEIVYLHDGCVAVSSRPGQGTKIIICLPYDEVGVDD